MGTLYKDPVFYVKSYKFDYKKIEANFILTDTKIETEEKKSVYSVFLVKKKKRGTKFKLIKILVDQLSTDESCQILLDKSERIIIIEIGENDGFCYNLVKSPK